MLQSMREKLQGIIAGSIVALIALTFALWGIQNYVKGGGETGVVVKVNGAKITQGELHQAYERAKRQQMLKSGAGFALDQAAQAVLKKQVLKRMIDTEIIAMAASKMGMGIGDQQLSMIIHQLPIFQENGEFSLTKFRQVIDSLLYTDQGFLSEVGNTAMISQLENGITESAFVLPEELETIQRLMNQKRDFGYFLISPDRFVNQVTITDDQLQAYYQGHQNEFMSPEKVSIEYIQLSGDSLKSQIHPTNEQLHQYYQENIGSFSVPKRWQITSVSIPLAPDADDKAVAAAKQQLEGMIKQIKSGKDFSQVAGSLARTSWVVASEVTPELVSTLDKLGIDQVSEPFRTQGGYNLVKLLEVQKAKQQDYAEVADKVKQAYLQQQLLQIFSSKNDKLADLSYTNSESLKPAADELGLKIQASDLFTAQGEKVGLLANPKVVKAAFSEEVLKQGYNSNPIEISPGNVLVLRVKQHLPEAVLPLVQVKELIFAKLKKEAVHKKLAALSQEVLSALKNKASIDQLSKQYGLSWRNVPHAGRRQAGINLALLQAAFSTPQPQAEGLSASAVDLGDQGYAIIQVNKVVDGEVQAISDHDKQQFQELFRNGFGQYEYMALVDNLIRKAKVSFEDPSLKD